MEISSTESISTDESSIDSYVCRLRSGLNLNCLIQVFEYLELSDLVVLLKMNDFYKEIILKWTMTKMLINIPFYIVPTEPGQEQQRELLDLFETFGSSMRKLELNLISMEHFLKLIMEYCTPATLVDVTLNIDLLYPQNTHKPTDSMFMDLAMPFFTNLRKITISPCSVEEEAERTIDLFLTKLLMNAVNLRTLVLDSLNREQGWCNHVKNVHKLTYLVIEQIHFANLINNIEMNPKLKKFTVAYGRSAWNDNNITSVGVALSKWCPHLEHFYDHQLGGIPLNNPTSSIFHRYDFLRAMTSLTRVGLTSFTSCCSDLYYPLKRLADAKITLLEIFVSQDVRILNENEIARIMNYELPEFNRLQTLKIFNYSHQDSNCRFIFRLVKHLKHLEVCSVVNIRSVHKILMYAPSIDVLCHQSLIDLDEKRCADIVKTLRKMRRLKLKQHSVNLRLPSGYDVPSQLTNATDVIHVSHCEEYCYLGDCR